jgi:hypothetical protein
VNINEVRCVQDIDTFVVQEFTAKGFDKELIHGLRHLRHVQSECDNINRLCGNILGSGLMKCLNVAVAVHDLGRTEKGDHAEISAEMFRQMPIEDLDLDEKDVIYFAVKNHSRGLGLIGVKKASSFQEYILGLLCVCDHADAASPDGAARAAMHMANKKASVLSSRFSASHLRQIMEESAPSEMMNEYKNDSLIAHWAYNYSATYSICQPVKHLLSDKYLEECYTPRMLMFFAIITQLLALQEATDKVASK